MEQAIRKKFLAFFALLAAVTMAFLPKAFAHVHDHGAADEKQPKLQTVPLGVPKGRGRAQDIRGEA